jgi:hypothetical protein
LIKPSVIAEAKRLLAEGQLSQRKIAALLGISRGTVGAIASGRRPDYQNRSTSDDEEPDIDPNAPKVRCGGCGGMVIMPCRACRDRAALAKAKRRPGAERTEPDGLNLQLRPEERTRYEQVREARRKAEAKTAGHELASFALSAEDEPIDEPREKAPADWTA